MGEIIGKGGSVVDLQWYQKDVNGPCTEKVTQLPETHTNVIKLKAQNKVNALAKEVVEITKQAQELRIKNFKEFKNANKYVEAIFPMQNGSQVTYQWNVDKLELIKSHYIDKNIDQKLAKLGAKEGLIFGNVISKVFKAFKEVDYAFYPILVSEKISPFLEQKQPVDFYRTVYNNPILKTLAFRCYEELNIK